MAKELYIKENGGSTYYMLPGSSGEFSVEAETIEDTIFGQTFNSNESGLITWTLNGNAVYKGQAGYTTTIKKQGTTTATTGEAMSVESGQIYKVDAATKEIWDRSATITVYDGTSDVTSEVEWYDYLFGRVKFDDTYTVVGAITADFSYFPTSALGKSNSFSLTMTADTIDTSDFGTVQGNSGYRTYDPGLRTVSIDLSGIYDSTAALKDEVTGRNELIIEVDLGAYGKSVARGFFKALTQSQSGDVGALEEESVTFELTVPYAADGSIYRPFGWYHATDTTLSQAIQIALTEFENETKPDLKYLYDGTNGWEGTVVLTDVSLETGLDSLNSFTINGQGTGAFTAVP